MAPEGAIWKSTRDNDQTPCFESICVCFNFHKGTCACNELQKAHHSLIKCTYLLHSSFCCFKIHSLKAGTTTNKSMPSVISVNGLDFSILSSVKELLKCCQLTQDQQIKSRNRCNNLENKGSER